MVQNRTEVRNLVGVLCADAHGVIKVGMPSKII